MTVDKRAGAYIYHLLSSIGIAIASLIVFIFVASGTSELTPEDKASVAYRYFGESGLKYGLLVIAAGLFLYGLFGIITNIRALRNAK